MISRNFSTFQTRPCRWTHLALAALAVALATLVRFPCQPLIGHASPFLFYFPVVLVIALAFGMKAGLVATFASLLPANYFWMAPERTFTLNLVESCQMVAFSIAGCSVSWLSEALHKQRQLKDFLNATLASAADAIVSIDCQGRIVYLNAMAEILTELQREEAVGSAIGSAFQFLGDPDRQPINWSFQAALNNEEIQKLPARVIILSKSGRQHYVEPTASRILDAKGRKMGAVILFHHRHTEMASQAG